MRVVSLVLVADKCLIAGLVGSGESLGSQPSRPDLLHPSNTVM
jgi:hypothetical protein